MIRLRVDELAHHPDFGIGLRAVGMIVTDVLPVPSAVSVGIDLRPFINIKLLRRDARCMDELHLLSLTITQRRTVLEGVEMVFIESLFGDVWHGHVRNGTRYFRRSIHV